MSYESDRSSYRGQGGGHGGGPGRGYGGHPGQQDRPRRSTPLSELDPALTGISHKVIGLATEVHMELGPGYDEATYINAMSYEMNRVGIAHKVHHPFEVYLDDQAVGRVAPDLFIDDKFLVDVMAAPVEIGWYERAVLRAQLRAADLLLGLVINFAGRRLKDGLVRVLNPDKLQKDEGAEFEDEPQAVDPGQAS